jgi:hypothetical protein
MLTNRKISIGLITLLVGVLAIVAATAIADGQHSGVWKLNPAKSKYSPGPGPKELTETIVLSTKRYKVDANGTAADGKPMHIEFDAKFDGKDYPMIGVPWADTLSVKWIGADTPQIIPKEGRPGHDDHDLRGFLQMERHARACSKVRMRKDAR